MYDELLKFAVQLAKAAGGIQLAYFRGDRLSIETKSNYTRHRVVRGNISLLPMLPHRPGRRS